VFIYDTIDHSRWRKIKDSAVQVTKTKLRTTMIAFDTAKLKLKRIFDPKILLSV